MWINKSEIEAKVMPKVFFIFHFTVHAKIAGELISLRSLIRAKHTAHNNGVWNKGGKEFVK